MEVLVSVVVEVFVSSCPYTQLRFL
jgi:hypothetical protein